MRIFFETNNRRLPLFTDPLHSLQSNIASLVWSFSGSEYSYCSDTVNTKTVTNANGFKTAVQSIDLQPVIPAEASVKLQGFLHARVRVCLF